MDTIVEKIAQKCLQANLVEENQLDWLIYTLQRRFMNLCGFVILISLGTMVAPFLHVLTLNLGLAFLREKTNGVHMPTKLSCFVFSLFFEYLSLFIICRLLSNVSVVSYILWVLSTVIILAFAPCNNSEIHCSFEELQTMKKAVYKRLMIYSLFICVLIVPRPSFANTMIMAETVVALLIILSKVGIGIH